MTYLHDDGTLVLARWSDALGSPLVDASRPGSTLMYGTDATAVPLVSNGSLGLDLVKVPAGAGFSPHTHPGDHLLVVVDGEGTITYDGRIYPTRAGQVYLVEGAVPHAVGAVTDHAVLAVGSPHREADAADRMALTEYAAEGTDVGTLHCLSCDVVAEPDDLADRGCGHAPVKPGDGLPLVVGLAPVTEDQPQAFVGTDSGRRLAALLGVDPDDLLSVVETVNLSSVPVDDWPSRSAEFWDDLAAGLRLTGRVVVAAGRTVARALGVAERVPWGTARVGRQDCLVIVVPHPSGLSRPYNDDSVRRRVEAVLGLARTFARCRPPAGSWGERDAVAITAAALA